MNVDTPEYTGLMTLVCLPTVIMLFFAISNIDVNPTEIQIDKIPIFTLTFDESKTTLVLKDSDAIKNEFCSLTKKEPFYNCDETWILFYFDDIQHFGSGKYLIAGTSATVKIDPESCPGCKKLYKVIVMGNETRLDTCGQTVIQHELRHLIDPDWDHSNCFIRLNQQTYKTNN